MRALSATLQKNGILHLASLISAERIVPDMVSREHQSAIAELVDHMDTLGLLESCGRDELLEALHSREGINFSAHDDAPMHLVILFIVPRQQYDQHLRTLAAIARLFHDDDMKRQLLESGTAREMLLTLQRRAPRAVAA